MCASLKYPAMVGFGPSAVIRGATFDCGLALDAEVAAAELLPAPLVFVDEEPQPARPMAAATTAMVRPVHAGPRFIVLGPVGRASWRVRESTRWRIIAPLWRPPAWTD